MEIRVKYHHMHSLIELAYTYIKAYIITTQRRFKYKNVDTSINIMIIDYSIDQTFL